MGVTCKYSQFIDNRAHYLSSNTGVRDSLNAAVPSPWSAEVNVMVSAAAAIFIAVSRSNSKPLYNISLDNRIAIGGPSAIFLAISIVLLSSSSSVTKWFRKPNRCASSASKKSPYCSAIFLPLLGKSHIA